MSKKSDLTLQTVTSKAIGLGQLLGKARVDFINYKGEDSKALANTVEFFQQQILAESKRIQVQFGYKAGDYFYDLAWAVSNIMVSQNQELLKWYYK